MRKILIVDDSAPMRTLVQMVMKNIEGVETLEAHDGEEALRLLDAHPDTDLLITDIVMPGMNGWELIRQVRQERMNAGLPILVLTSDYVLKSSDEYLNSGANDILLKPFQSKRLEDKVKQLLP